MIGKKEVIFGIFLLGMLFLMPLILASPNLFINIESNQAFIADASNNYSVIVTTNETSAIDINFSIRCLIMRDDKVIKGYPKKLENNLTSQRVIIQEWMPKDIGNYSICCRILNSTIEDQNSTDNFACKDITITESVPVEKLSLKQKIEKYIEDKKISTIALIAAIIFLIIAVIWFIIWNVKLIKSVIDSYKRKKKWQEHIESRRGKGVLERLEKGFLKSQPKIIEKERKW